MISQVFWVRKLRVVRRFCCRYGRLHELRAQLRVRGHLLEQAPVWMLPIISTRSYVRRVPAGDAKMKSTGEVYLNLFGDEFNPDEVNEHIGLVGATVRRKGERRPEVPLPRVSSWAFSTGKIEDEVIDVYAMSEALITKLAPYVEKIVEVKEKFALTCVLQVVLRIDQDETKSMPAIGFEHAVIDFLNAVGGTIDIDTYRN
jgi:hypothetical protein